MGRNSRLKRAKRQDRRRSLNEAWRYFTSRSFLSQVRKMILDSGAQANSCIACTKVLTQLGSSIGLTVRPLVVETSVFNPVFADYIAQHGLTPEAETMHSLGQNGGRFVVVGARSEEGRELPDNVWPGHLVAAMSAPRKPTMILDISIDQASRPGKDIHINGPVVFGAPEGFLTGNSVATGFVPTQAGKICFVYRAFPDDVSFMESPDWQRDYGARTHDKLEIVTDENVDR